MDEPENISLERIRWRMEAAETRLQDLEYTVDGNGRPGLKQDLLLVKADHLHMTQKIEKIEGWLEKISENTEKAKSNTTIALIALIGTILAALINGLFGAQ